MRIRRFWSIVSPEDARTLKRLRAPTLLKGVGLMHFAAFVSRTNRENDYVLGRLQAGILDTEAPQLPNSCPRFWPRCSNPSPGRDEAPRHLDGL